MNTPHVPPHPAISTFINARQNTTGNNWSTPVPTQHIAPRDVQNAELVVDRADRGLPRLIWKLTITTPTGPATYYLIDSYTEHAVNNPDLPAKQKSAFFTEQPRHQRERWRTRLQTRITGTRTALRLGIPIPHHIFTRDWIASHDAGTPITDYTDNPDESPYTDIDFDHFITDTALLLLLGVPNPEPKHLIINDTDHPQRQQHAFIDIHPYDRSYGNNDKTASNTPHNNSSNTTSHYCHNKTPSSSPDSSNTARSASHTPSATHPTTA